MYLAVDHILRARPLLPNMSEGCRHFGLAIHEPLEMHGTRPSTQNLQKVVPKGPSTQIIGL